MLAMYETFLIVSMVALVAIWANIVMARAQGFGTAGVAFHAVVGALITDLAGSALVGNPAIDPNYPFGITSGIAMTGALAIGPLVLNWCLNSVKAPKY